jgi:hypothetical protein
MIGLAPDTRLTTSLLP